MTDRGRKLLADIRDAGTELIGYTSGRSEAEYLADRVLRLMVERLFLIIGEAAARLRREAPDAAEKLAHLRGAVAFRNFLIHAYDAVDDRAVWRIVVEDVGTLVEEVKSLLAE